MSADASALWARWRDVARVFFLRHGRVDREDLAHEALLALVAASREGRLQHDENAGPFLLGICRNLLKRQARKDQRRARAELKLVEGTAAPQESGLDLRRLWECFNGLSARSRQVVERSFLLEEETREIGAALRMAEGNVRVVRHRALVALRDCVEGRKDPPAP
jgi:RNA polymerase sigma factor (sigma-70 family)